MGCFFQIFKLGNIFQNFDQKVAKMQKSDLFITFLVKNFQNIA